MIVVQNTYYEIKQFNRLLTDEILNISLLDYFGDRVSRDLSKRYLFLEHLYHNENIDKFFKENFDGTKYKIKSFLLDYKEILKSVTKLEKYLEILKTNDNEFFSLLIKNLKFLIGGITRNMIVFRLDKFCSDEYDFDDFIGLKIPNDEIFEICFFLESIIEDIIAEIKRAKNLKYVGKFMRK
ncbi:MAG: hypothetical protein LBJ32_00650 [Oscillospiraceae bacterium]|jgi:hypothetical protein|nr:hypothetical protein [Oscillospiraceae bacterium]